MGSFKGWFQGASRSSRDWDFSVVGFRVQGVFFRVWGF